MPPPPEDVNLTDMPLLDFTSVECLLYAFHRLARQCPDFLTCDPAVLKDFRARLMYFARAVQGCSKALADNKKRDDDKERSETDLLKQRLTPKLFANLNMLIKDLFYQPPVYKCNVTLSYKNGEVAVVNVSWELCNCMWFFCCMWMFAEGYGEGCQQYGFDKEAYSYNFWE